jgi:hypothetical protein
VIIIEGGETSIILFYLEEVENVFFFKYYFDLFLNKKYFKNNYQETFKNILLENKDIML